MEIILEHWETIFAVIGIILSAVSPVLARAWQRNKVTVAELVEVIDDSPTRNTQFKKRAEALGKKMAGRALDKILA